MKKILLYSYCLILSLLCLTACGGVDDSMEVSTVKVTSVKLSATELSLTVGEKKTLTATVSPVDATDKTVIWQSSNTSVASVSSTGEVMAIGEGTATITAKCGDKSASCTVKVNLITINVTSITLSEKQLSLTVGDTFTLVANVFPDNATNKTITWGTTNSEIATVSTSGKITALGSGTVTITASCGNVYSTCSVTVKQQQGGVNAGIGSWGENESFEGTVK